MMVTTKELKIGQVYLIHHKRKGTFVAQLIGIQQASADDEADDIFLKVKYDVRQGTAQANLAISPKDRVRVSGLRPSLITSMEPTEEQNWLREVKVPEEIQSKPNKNLRSKLRDLFGKEDE
ncbi:MAG TPA: hypothetical protein VI729_13140 [Anaerolineales bacterium]|nr:hypothetical protein [Anaerolineales bacterium]